MYPHPPPPIAWAIGLETHFFTEHLQWLLLQTSMINVFSTYSQLLYAVNYFREKDISQGLENASLKYYKYYQDKLP